MSTFSETLRRYRRAAKAALPFVRRRKYDKVAGKYAELINDLGWYATPANQSGISALKSLDSTLAGEVCFFVSFAPDPVLKPHVTHHIKQLLNAGIAVVLVLNTEIPASEFIIDPDLLRRVSAVYVRANAGFDFAAWAHAYSICVPHAQWDRLFLVNDSIVGPFNIDDFSRILERVRNSKADFVGLTEKLAPNIHLQSFFLVFNKSALIHPWVRNWFMRVVNLATKSFVIDVYEIRLTQMLHKQGLVSETLFPAPPNEPYPRDATIHHWDKLISEGFPFIKHSIIKKFPNHVLIRDLVSDNFKS